MTALTLPTEGLPLSKAAAIRLGSRFYASETVCPKGHQSPRYTRGGSCVICTREKNVRHLTDRLPNLRSRGLMSIARSSAVEVGSTTFEGSPCKLGHTLRYTASNNCCACSAAALVRDAEKRRWARRRKLYGIDESGYLALRASQNEACPICTDALPDITKTHIDHCHETGRVRGLLCGPCNQGIGLLRESEAIMRRAIAYVAS